jgi:hypothetical protein
MAKLQIVKVRPTCAVALLVTRQAVLVRGAGVLRSYRQNTFSTPNPQICGSHRCLPRIIKVIASGSPDFSSLAVELWLVYRKERRVD